MYSRIFFDKMFGDQATLVANDSGAMHAPQSLYRTNQDTARSSRESKVEIVEQDRAALGNWRNISESRLREKHVFLHGSGDQVDVARAAYKALRTRVIQQMENRETNSLLVVGPTKDIGKTLTAANLALMLSRHQERSVVLVDLDLRSPSLHKLFEFKPVGDIVDIASGRMTLNEVLIDSGIRGLRILPGTVSYEDSSEHLMSSEMLEVFQTLAALPETIVVYDTPPILGCDDVSAISPHMDSCLMVVRQGDTSRRELHQSLKLLSGTINVLGITVNCSTEGNFDAYYY